MKKSITILLYATTMKGSKCTKSKQFYFIEPTLNDLNKKKKRNRKY